MQKNYYIFAPVQVDNYNVSISNLYTVATNSIRIVSTENNAWTEEVFNEILLHLKSVNPEIEVVFSTEKSYQIYDILNHNIGDIVLLPLERIGVNLPENVAITALSRRKEVQEVLLLTDDAYDEEMDFRIKSGATIMVKTPRQQHQLIALRPDLKLTQSPFDLSDGILSTLDKQVPEGHSVVKLNPREYNGEPGCGTMACLVLKENVPIRKLLKGFHHRETAEITNLERGLIKSNTNPDLEILGAYCEKRNDHSFHLYACGLFQHRFVKTKVSQSTSSGLVDNTLKALQDA